MTKLLQPALLVILKSRPPGRRLEGRTQYGQSISASTAAITAYFRP